MPPPPVDLHPQFAPWPYQQLDLHALRRRGWRPQPFREFVLKIQGHCNLACDYCYVYTKADQSWRTRRAAMPASIWRAASRRIAEHVERHGLDHIQVILHGGEPLLGGVEPVLAAAASVRTAVQPLAAVSVALQTNGTLLDERTLARLAAETIAVGVSLDGPEEDHDRHRRYPDGRGTFVAVAEALRLLGQQRYRAGFSGILATIDPATDPVRCYETLLGFRPKTIDFLLPHANWSAPHPASRTTPHPFGDWLVKAFDRWYDAPWQQTTVQLFEDLMVALLRGTSGSERFGLSPAALAVVESDGSIEQVDTLKSAYPGACATGLSVLCNTFDEALGHPGFAARQIGTEALSPTCLRCDLHQICGGGQYPHRYRTGEGFRHPSVYCRDLARLIAHIQCRMTTDLRRWNARCQR